jgi:transcriptional regulator with XRE-family HTH domain
MFGWSPAGSMPNEQDRPNPDDRARAQASYIQDRVARAVRDQLRKAHRTQEDLAIEIGWSSTRLSRQLTGRQVLSLEDAMRLLDACGLSWSAVFMATDDPNQRSLAEFHAIGVYLTRQKTLVEERIADIERALAST